MWCNIESYCNILLLGLPLFLSEAFPRTEYKIQEVLHLSSREEYLPFMTKSASCKMAAIRTSQRTLAPPNVLWVPVCRHQTWLHTWLHQTYLVQLLLALLMKSLKPIFKWQVAVSSSSFYIYEVDLLDYGEYFGEQNV